MIMRRIHFLPGVAAAHRVQESVAAPALKAIKNDFGAIASNFAD
jgi:hypothetical protein